MPPPKSAPPAPTAPAQPEPPPLSYEGWQEQQREAALRRHAEQMKAMMPGDTAPEVLERDLIPLDGYVVDCWSCGSRHRGPENGGDCPAPDDNLPPGPLDKAAVHHCICGDAHPPRQRVNKTWGLCRHRFEFPVG